MASSFCHIGGLQAYGYWGPVNTETLAMSATSTLAGFGFICPPDANKTLDKVKMYATGVTGTLVSGDLRCTIYGVNTSMNPSGSLGNTTSVTALPTGAAWFEFNFSPGISLTAGDMYYAVLDCPNAPSRYVTIRVVYAAGMGGVASLNSSTNWGPNFKRSTDSGSTWSTNPRENVGGIRLQYSDPAFDGSPLSRGGDQGASYGVYAAREYGAYFTTPSNVTLNVIGIAARTARTGTPSITTRFRLYTGSGGSPTLQRTSKLLPYATQQTTYQQYIWRFASVYQISAGTIVRIVLCTGDGSSGSSSNYFSVMSTDVENNSDSKALGAAQGTWQETYYNGSSWAERDTIWPFAALILDPSGEFASAGGAGGLLVHPGMAGGMRG